GEVQVRRICIAINLRRKAVRMAETVVGGDILFLRVAVSFGPSFISNIVNTSLLKTASPEEVPLNMVPMAKMKSSRCLLAPLPVVQKPTKSCLRSQLMEKPKF